MRYAGLFPLSILFLSACMCTPSADVEYVRGIQLYAPEEVSSSEASFTLGISVLYGTEAGKNKRCLSYNKEEPEPVIQNAVIPSTVVLTCNRSIDGHPAGSVLPLPAGTLAYSRIRSYPLQLPVKGMITDSLYVFSITAQTIEGHTLASADSLRLIP